jgi:hypothetical protein
MGLRERFKNFHDNRADHTEKYPHIVAICNAYELLSDHARIDSFLDIEDVLDDIEYYAERAMRARVIPEFSDEQMFDMMEAYLRHNESN